MINPIRRAVVAKSIGAWLGNWKVTSSSPGKTKCYRGVPEQGTTIHCSLGVHKPTAPNTRMGQMQRNRFVTTCTIICNDKKS